MSTIERSIEVQAPLAVHFALTVEPGALPALAERLRTAGVDVHGPSGARAR